MEAVAVAEAAGEVAADSLVIAPTLETTGHFVISTANGHMQPETAAPLRPCEIT